MFSHIYCISQAIRKYLNNEIFTKYGSYTALPREWNALMHNGACISITKSEIDEALNGHRYNFTTSYYNN